MPDEVAQVVLDSPLPHLDHLFDYHIPSELADEVRPGVRVKAPLRVAGRTADGYVVGTATTSSAPGRLSELDRVVSPAPVLAPEVWHLARAVADRAAGTASDVLRLAVPKRQARVEKAWLAAPPDPPATPSAASTPVATELLAGRRIAAEAVPRLTEVAGEWIGDWAVEVAAHAAAVAAEGRSVIVAAPARRDLDQLEAALVAGPAAANALRIDAARPAAERYRAHLAALGGGPWILFGNRSAVYAPAADLGALIVWDAAGGFHREPLAPYAGTRDVALLRQEQSGSGLLLLAHARSTAVQRLVRVGWVAGAARPRPTPKVVLTPDDDPGRRIPSAAWRDAREALATGPVLVQVARPGDAALRALGSGEAVPPPDAGRTAHDLGRAFPGVRVLVADGEQVRDTIDAEPALVVATRGAEPRVSGGYWAVLLLDGRRMLARESLLVAEDCLRWWANAAALAAPGAPVHLVGVQGDVAVALATWNSPGFADRQLADRRSLRFPPAVRLAQLPGSPALVDELVEELSTVGAEALVRGQEGGEARVVLRFDYAAGHQVAATAKAAIVRRGPRRRPAGPGRPAPTLKVRFDVPEP